MDRKDKKILWSAIVLYIVVMTAASLWKYELFRYNAIDLAYYNQVFWKTIHGEPFGLTIHPHLSLGDHIEPFLLLLAPFYWLLPDARMLLLLQSLALALTALPIYFIAYFLLNRGEERRFGDGSVVGVTRFDPQSLAQGERARTPTAVGGASPSGSAISSQGKLITSLRNESVTTAQQNLPLLFALLWLVNPLIHNVNLMEFHILPFALPFLFLAILAYEKKQMRRFILWALIALTVREDVALAIGAFALLAIIDVVKKRRSWHWIAVPFFLGIAWFILAQKIAAIYAVGGSYKFLVYYAWLGDSFPHIIVNSLRHPLLILAHVATGNTLLLILALGTPFLFLFFARPRYLILALPIAAQHLLATYGGDPLIAETHYVTLLLPGLVLATMAALINPPRFISLQGTGITQSNQSDAVPLSGVDDQSRHGSADEAESGGRKALSGHAGVAKVAKRNATEWVPLILLIIATLYSASTTLDPLYGIITERVSSTERQERNYFIAQIPPDASVATTESFLTPLSRRNAVYLLRYVFAGETQYGKAPYHLPESAQYILIDTNDLVAYNIGSVAILRTAFAPFGVIAANGPFVLLKRGVGAPLLTLPSKSSPSAEAIITHEQPCRVPPLAACAHLTLTANNTDGTVALLRASNSNPLFLPLAYGMRDGILTQSHYWIPENKNISITMGDVAHTLVLANDRAVDYRHTIMNERSMAVNEVQQSQ